MAGLQNKSKLIFGIIFLSLLIFVSACTKPIDVVEKNYCKEEDRLSEVCTQVAKPVCGYNSDDEQLGTYSNSCYACKEADYWVEGECLTHSECNYDDPNKRYIGKSKEDCSRIRYVCETQSESFQDDCGCGCISILGDEEELDKSIEELDSIADI